jgi:carboxyl-terminal processing protease
MQRTTPLWILAVATVATPAGAQEPIDSTLALATFDTAWQIVYETHFDTTFNGVDWVALRDELRPRVAAATERAELRGIVSDMLERLGQSHFALIPEEVADTLNPEERDVAGAVGDVGLDMRLVHDTLLVTAVDSGGPAHQAGVRPGWIVAAVGDVRVEDLVAASREAESRVDLRRLVWGRMQRTLQGPPDTDCTIEFLDAQDRPVSLVLTRRTFPNEPVKLGNLPTLFSRFARRQEVVPGSNVAVGIVWFNFWMVPLIRQFDQAIDDFRGLDGIVIDLRGNGGGVGAMIVGVAGHFLDDRVSLGTTRTLAILSDRLTGSASEIFAGGMQAVERVRVFGDTSAGAVLPAALDRLPNRDVLYHAFGDFVTPTGVTLEGRGVIPDEPVPITRIDLLAGRDMPMLTALRWIAERRLQPSAPEP